jgi:hypothetical protein
MTTNIDKWNSDYNTMKTNYQNYRTNGACSSSCNTSCDSSKGLTPDTTSTSNNKCILSSNTDSNGNIISFNYGCNSSCKYTDQQVTSLMATWVNKNPIPTNVQIYPSTECSNTSGITQQNQNSCICQEALLTMKGESDLNDINSTKYNLDKTTYNNWVQNTLNPWINNYNTALNNYSSQRQSGTCVALGSCYLSQCSNGWTDSGSGTNICMPLGCQRNCKPDTSSVNTYMQQWVQNNPIYAPTSTFDNNPICNLTFSNSSDSNGNIIYTPTCPMYTYSPTPISNNNIICCNQSFSNISGNSNFENIVNNCILEINNNLSSSTPSVSTPISTPTTIPTPTSTPSVPTSTPSTTFGEKLKEFFTNKWVLIFIGIIITIVVVIIVIMFKKK